MKLEIIAKCPRCKSDKATTFIYIGEVKANTKRIIDFYDCNSCHSTFAYQSISEYNKNKDKK